MELASYNYTIRYRPGAKNTAQDALSRAYCASMPTSALAEIHSWLCHPGITRMLHFLRSKNLPFSTEDVKRVCSSCRVCAETKPQFYRQPGSMLIKATQPMERLSIDFKGPVVSNSKNMYLFTAIDEFSRFPFAFACADMSSETVKRCLDSIFSLCGMVGFVHSDRGASFLSRDVKVHLTRRGIASSATTPYHPEGNSQCERFNGIIWKAIQLALKDRDLPVGHWELVLPDALHSIRSLLSTSTNETPHERFFNFFRRSGLGHSLPAWLLTPGPVLLRRFVRHTKNDPLVDEVELLEANPTFARVRYPGGRESSVSLRDLAPCPRVTNTTAAPSSEVAPPPPSAASSTRLEPETSSSVRVDAEPLATDVPVPEPQPQPPEPPTELRRSSRERRRPDHFGFAPVSSRMGECHDP